MTKNRFPYIDTMTEGKPLAILGSEKDYSTDKSDPHIPPGLKARIEARDEERRRINEELKKNQALKEARDRVIKETVVLLIEGFLDQPEQLHEGATQEKIAVGIIPALVKQYNLYVENNHLDEDAYYVNQWVEEALNKLLANHRIGVICEMLDGAYRRYYFARPQK